MAKKPIPVSPEKKKRQEKAEKEVGQSYSPAKVDDYLKKKGK